MYKYMQNMSHYFHNKIKCHLCTITFGKMKLIFVNELQVAITNHKHKSKSKKGSATKSQ